MLPSTPPQIDNLLQQAVALHQTGRLREAKSLYEQILLAQPRHADALHLLGVVFLQAGESQKAADLIVQANGIAPGNPAQHMNLGLALKALGRSEDALASYDKALALRPKYPDAWNNRGAVLQDLKRPEDALESYNQAIVFRPDFAEAFSNRGAVLRDLKRPDAALASYDRAIGLNPGLAEAFCNRGAVLQDLRRLDEALACYDHAITLNPAYADAWNNRGALLRQSNRFDEALAVYDHAIALAPGHADAHANRGFVLRDLGRLPEAAESYALALSLKPDFEFLPGYWLQTKMQICAWENLPDNLGKIQAGIRAGQKTITPFPLLGLNDDSALHKSAAVIYTNAKFRQSGAAPSPASGGKIRLGYYSADFHNHATAWLIAELLECHDRTRFELYAFSFGPDTQDEMQRRIATACDHFLDVRDKSDGEIAALSRQHGIAIAMDLKGHTQNSRPGIFAEGAAPIQAQYLGYPGTMGAPYMDYIIGDAIVTPPGCEAHYSEKILRLPHCYQANDSSRRISEKSFTRADFGLPPTGFVFCCFNNNYKILPGTFDCWMRILKAVEGSVLWLIEDNGFVAENLRKHAAAGDVDPARLIFAGRVPLEDHLARHCLADLFLDTWPYNAHTTASDALWAGVPLLTRMGEAFAGRVAASLLTTLELPDLITRSNPAYEMMAISLARNPAKLAGLREKLAQNRTASSLFDGKRIAQSLEKGYDAMLARHRARLPPDHIEASA